MPVSEPIPTSEQLEAAILIIEGQPPSKVMRLFGSRREAVTFYAGIRAKQFDQTKMTLLCTGCGARPLEMAARYTWRSMFSRFSPIHLLALIGGHLGIPVKTGYIEFSTFHAFCQPCWRRARYRRLFGRACEGLSFLALLAGLLLGPIGLLAPFVITHLKSNEQWAFLGVGVGGLALISFSLTSRRWMRMLYVPAALRGIAAKPFGFHSASKAKGGE